MRREALFIETPSMPKGCVTCKKRSLRCDGRKPACKRCTLSGRTCEGYSVSTARKPSDVTPESVLEFRQQCLPSREHPKKALVVLPVVYLETPNVLHSFATIVSNGLVARDDFMMRIVRAVLSHSRRLEKSRKTSGRRREMSVVRFHEPVKEIFDLERPESCPVVRSAFMMQMYRILMHITMSKGHTSDKAIHDLSVGNS